MLRKLVVRASHLDELVGLGSLTPAAARFLDSAVRSRLNVLVSGGTQAGKTTLLNCLAAAFPPQERVVTAEEVFELKIPLPDVVSLQCRVAALLRKRCALLLPDGRSRRMLFACS